MKDIEAALTCFKLMTPIKLSVEYYMAFPI